MIKVALDLLAMEGSFVLILAALGSGPAALVPGPLPLLSRIAIAPALGLAGGSGLLLTASQFMSMSLAAWVLLVPLSLLSVAVALWRMRASREVGAAPLGHVLLIFAAVAVPLVVFDAPLVDQRTTGPAGYVVADAAGYVRVNAALEDHSWRDDRFGQRDDRLFAEYLRSPVFQTGTGPLAAAMNQAFGWRAIDSQSALMVALVVIGASGCFGLLLAATGSGLAGVAAATLYAGPVSYQLFVDSSEAALAGLALFGAIGMLALPAVRGSPPAAVLVGLLAGGVMTLYPAYLPPLAGAVVLGLAAHLWRRRGAAGARRSVVSIAAMILVAIAVSPVGLTYNVDYARAVSAGAIDEKPATEAVYEEPVVTQSYGRTISIPSFNAAFPRQPLPASAAPAWLLQSRDRYYLPAVGQGPLLGWMGLGVVVPSLVVLLGVCGAMRFSRLGSLLLAIPPILALTLYSYAVRDCPYCGQRPLLLLGPIGACLAAGGLVAAAPWLRRRLGRRSGTVALAAMAAVVAGIALQKDSVLAQRLTQGGYLLGEDARSVLDAAQRHPAIALEGSGAGVASSAILESQLLDDALKDETGTVPVLDWRGLPLFFYFPDDPPAEREIAEPGYNWVMTRLAGIDTPRATLYREGPYAIQRPASPLDVMVTSGVVSDLPQRDPSGNAWVTGPVEFTIVGVPRAWLTVELTGPSVGSLRLTGRAQVIRRTSNQATICLPVPGRRAVRRARLALDFDPLPESPPPDPYGVPVPGKGLQLSALAATTHDCTRRGAA
ncbi:MAG TPA: hypothetical protein VEK39_14450 [Solirubrobacterales bacterium]|nr:hypothetical protein [Solirubrobacterales bacterium]